MKSTGEVMGIDADFPQAFAKSQSGAWADLPTQGTAFLSVKNKDKPAIIEIARELVALGFDLVATGGTCQALNDAGLPAERVNKVKEGRPHSVDAVKNGAFCMAINTVGDAQGQADSFFLRREAITQKMSYFTTVAAGRAAVMAIGALAKKGMHIQALQDYIKQA